MEDQWLRAAKRLHALAETGKQFTRDEFDLERYEEIADIAMSLMASLAHSPVEAIEQLVSANGTGYVTPKVDVRGAVFNQEKILLVQEKSDGLWTLPGGYADVGLSPGENVVKEVYEEAGIRVRARQLYSVRHKARGEYAPDVRDFYKLFFLCDAEEDVEVTAGPEVSDAGYFSKDAIPPLSTGRVVLSDLAAAWRVYQRGDSETHFD